MLPLLRVLPIGSILLSLLILLLAESPPVGHAPALPLRIAPARGPLIDAREHPEWREFMLQAAFRRADEIGRLRDLPDTPTRMPAPVVEPEAAIPAVEPQPAAPVPPVPEPPVVAAPAVIEPPVVQSPAEPTPAEPAAASEPATPPQQIAALPADREAAEPDDVTGAIRSAEKETLPMEIGETSSTELPIVLPRERPPIRRIAPRPKTSHAKAPAKVAHAAKPKRPAGAAKKPQAQPAAQPNGFKPFSFSQSQSAQ
jgi:hypothetical protein